MRALSEVLWDFSIICSLKVKWKNWYANGRWRARNHLSSLRTVSRSQFIFLITQCLFACYKWIMPRFNRGDPIRPRRPVYCAQVTCLICRRGSAFINSLLAIKAILWFIVIIITVLLLLLLFYYYRCISRYWGSSSSNSTSSSSSSSSFRSHTR